jgi:IMP cyclohydrolase
LPGRYLVGNGEQVRSAYETLRSGGSFDAALTVWAHEPDAPHYTPRISALLDLQTPPGILTLSILKANVATPEATDRCTYRPAPPPAGLGVCLTTYSGDGHPLPSFSGEPLLLPCPGRADELLEMYWQALDVSNRIAMAVKRIPADGSPSTIILHNRFAG